MLQTRKRTAVFLSLAVAVGAMCCLPAVAKGPSGGGGGGSTTTPFSVIELSALSSPNAISNPNDGSVTVVGNSGLNAAYWRVNVATRQVTASGSLPQPDNSSTALDVNSSRVIVGAANATSDSYWAPSCWLPVPSGGYDYQALPLLTGDDSGSAKAINEAGEMVGSSDPPYIPPPPGEEYEVISRAVYWTVDADGEFTVDDLNDWLSPEDSARWVLKEASDINNSGQVVGSGLLDTVERGFVLDLYTGEIAPVPLAAGATWNNAQQINDAGHVVGRGGPYSLPRGNTGSWSYFWGGPGTSPLLLPSTKDGAAFALGINRWDELAGKSTIAGLSDHDGKDYEFMSLWEPDATGTFTVTDLGTQIPSNPTWYLRSGEGINDEKWIVGIARKTVKRQSSWHGVLLVPNP